MYESKRDKTVHARIIKEDTERKTVIIEYLSGNKKGKNTCITTSTLKRWWNKVDEKVFSMSKNVENNPEKEIHKKQTTKIDRTKDIKKIVEMLVNDYKYKYYDSVKCYTIYVQSTAIAEVYPRIKNIEVRVKKVKEDFDSDVFYKDGYKYYLPVHYYVSYETDYIKIIKDLLS